MSPFHCLSIFFPVLDEAPNIELLVQEALAVLPGIASWFEVIIVDDGSTDGTSDLADQLAARHPDIVRVVHHQRNRGYGGALKSGFAAARYEWIFFTDGDRQFRLTELPAFLESLRPGIDMLIGYRLKRSESLHRVINTLLYRWMIRCLFGLKVRDIDCAYKLIHRRVLETMTLESDGALISAELLIKAQQRGFRWVEAGVRHYPRVAGKPTGARIGVILRMFRELFRNYRRLRQKP